MTKSDQIKKFIEWFKKQPVANNGMARSYFVSGCTTYVSPIMFFDDWDTPNVTVQWGGNRAPKKLLEKCKETFPGLISYCYFVKSDGSCPSEIVFKF